MTSQTGPIFRVVRFGIRPPTKRKAALLDDALRRQTIAYGRALENVRPEAVRWLRLETQRQRTHLSVVRQAQLRVHVRDSRRAIKQGAYQAAKTAVTSAVMADAIVQDVLATLTGWIGWRFRFREERPGRIKRAESAKAVALADLPAAIARLQARRHRAIITEAHIRTKVEARLARERQRRPPTYPVGPRLRVATSDYAGLLDALATSTTKTEEDRLRDALATQPRPGLHPLAWVRPQDDKEGRGVSLIWDNDRLFAFLPGLLPGTARRLTKPLNDLPKQRVGVTGLERLTQSGGVLLPLRFSRAAWAYLDNWSVRTAHLVKRHAHYELHVVFAGMVSAAVIAPGRWLGVDRGIINIAAAADDQGTMVWTSGNALAGIERRLRAQREGAQRRGAAATQRHFRAAARNEVNRIAKHIVGLAVRLHARVSAEDLTAFNRGDSRILAPAQFAGLLQAIEGGLERRGYAPLGRGGKRVWKVRAAGTSQGCAACGHTEAANRPTRDIFRCMACGHVANPDTNAAVNIARRGQETNTARQGRAGRAVGLGASALGVVARPATAEGSVAPPGGVKCL